MRRALAVLALAASSTFAGTISYTGTLDPNNPNDSKLIQFSVSTLSTVNLQSYGFGGTANAPGGTNAASTVIPPGGFDTYFSLFQGFGDGATFLLSNDDGSCPPGAPVGLACADSTIDTVLAAGDYTLAVTTFGNMSWAENDGYDTLGAGFIGLGNYWDVVNGVATSSAYAVDISTSEYNPTREPTGGAPEPGSFALLGSAGVLFVLSRLRRSGSTN